MTRSMRWTSSKAPLSPASSACAALPQPRSSAINERGPQRLSPGTRQVKFNEVVTNAVRQIATDMCDLHG
jgi:hypothetical protein